MQIYAVRKYLQWVKSRGVKVAEQAKGELPKSPLRQQDVLPPDMFAAYFRQADIDLSEPIRTAVMLLPCCGLRAQEMVRLRLEHVHRATVKLRKGKEKSTLFFRFVGKGDKERNVPLMEEGVEILTGYLTGWRRRQPGPWLFPHLSKGTRNKRYHGDQRSISTIFDAEAARATRCRYHPAHDAPNVHHDALAARRGLIVDRQDRRPRQRPDDARSLHRHGPIGQHSSPARCRRIAHGHKKEKQG